MPAVQFIPPVCGAPDAPASLYRRRVAMALVPMVTLLASSLLGACSSLGALPWERGTLAREDMQLEADGVQAGLDEHIYFSKEASSGGRGFGGGGCGCN